MTQSYRCIIKRLAGLLALVSLLIIFKDVAITLVDKTVLPITSRVRPDSPAVHIFVILFIIAVYITSGLLINKKNYVRHPEHTFYLFAVALVFYSLFRFNDHFVFYGVSQVAYVDAAFITAAILEILSYTIPVNRHMILEANVNAFVSDNPSKKDILGRLDYAELLLDKICATYKSGSLADGSMTILLNERYGAGKTTFLNLLNDKAKVKVRTCVFKPWQTSDGGGMSEELLKLIGEQYAIISQLGKQLEGYSKLLAGSDVKYLLDIASHLVNRRNSLSQRYNIIKEMLQVINAPLIVLVDDVDRLQAEELLSLLKLLRDTADFPNIIYIVAADKEAMSQMLESKGIKDADEYLKKFFNFELLFPIDDSYLSSLLGEQMVNALTNYNGSSCSMTSIEKEFLSSKYVQNVFSSPRDVYRFVNLLTYTLDLFKRYGVLEEVYVLDLLKLMLIQFISPSVYKILRDEMDLLLNVRGYDGRIHLKDGFKDIIISRHEKKQLQDLIYKARQTGNDKQADADNNAIEVEDMTLFDIPAQERPNKEDIVSDILRDLFYDTQNYREKSRICYLGEYFKFFAGKYSKGELSAQYMKELMESPSETDFRETMNLAIEQGKASFLVHKLKQYIDDKTIKKDIPYVLNRCIMIQDAVYRDWAQRQSFGKSPIDYYQMEQFQPVYMNLLIVDAKNIVKDSQEIRRVDTIYKENNQYAWLAASLTFRISADYDMFFVYGQEVLVKIKVELIHRFIVEELAENPFEIDKIRIIPMLKNMYHTNWDDQFKEYVSNSQDPLSWLYILLEPSGDLLDWNYEYYHNLVGEGTLYSYASDIYGFELPKELSSDLHQISGIQNIAALSLTNFNHHTFLVEAKKWWDAKKGKK